MSAVTASLCSTLMFVLFVSADQKIITAESGQDVTLKCRAPKNNTGVKWSRADLRDKYVLLFRDGDFNSANQHKSFKNRVDLKNRQIKDRDVSLILKNVRTDDDGKYECYVSMEIETPYWELINIIYLSVTPDKKFIPAESGQDVTLPCRAPNNNNFTVLKWSRADLKPEFVLLYRDERFDPDNQHPSFQNRVFLQDRQMKDGDVSLILKNVTTADNGTYVCRVFIEETRSWDLRSIIHLHVDPPGQPGFSGWMIALIILLVVLGSPVVFFFAYYIYKKIEKQVEKFRKRVKTGLNSEKQLNSESSEALQKETSETPSDITQRKVNKQGQKETDHQTHLLSSQHE